MAVPVEVEVGVVGEVDGSGGTGNGGGVVETEFVGVGESVGHAGFHRSRVALVSIRRGDAELHRVRALHCRLPNLLKSRQDWQQNSKLCCSEREDSSKDRGEVGFAAVTVMGRFVDGKLDLASVEGEGSGLDSVADASDGLAETATEAPIV